MAATIQSLDRFRDAGVFILRIAFGFQLVRVSWDYAVHPSLKIPEFIQYLTTLGFPFPTVGAYLSAYTEFVGGFLIVLGLWTRPAAVFLVINFTVAFLLAHIAINDTYQNTFPSANLLAVMIFLLLNGAGRYSVDDQLEKERGQRA